MTDAFAGTYAEANQLDMKYSTENWTTLLLEKVPGFQQVWEEHLEYWDGEPAGITNDMIELAAYANALIAENKEQELQVIFDLIESMIVDGKDELKDAACTGFLESILNPITAESPEIGLLNRLVGPHSRAYCKAWLRFSGNDLPGFE